MSEEIKERIKRIEKDIKHDEQQLRELGGFGATVRLRWVWCGKNCHGCPHGPYYYAYKKHNKKLKEIYIGKDAETALNYQAAQQIIIMLKRKYRQLKELKKQLKQAKQARKTTVIQA